MRYLFCPYYNTVCGHAEVLIDHIKFRHPNEPVDNLIVDSIQLPLTEES